LPNLAKYTYGKLSLEQHHKIEEKKRKKENKNTRINDEKEPAKNSTFCTGNGIFFLMRIPKLHYKFMSHRCFLRYAKEDPTL
jgi:hypothetical protein